MQPCRARAQNFDQPPAEARAAAGRGDHQRAVEAQPRGFVRDAQDRARREHHALRRQVMNERDHAAHVRRDYSDHGCSREESLRSPHRLTAGYGDCKNFRER